MRFSFNEKQLKALSQLCFDVAKTLLLGFLGTFLMEDALSRMLTAVAIFLLSGIFLYAGLFFLEEEA